MARATRKATCCGPFAQLEKLRADLPQEQTSLSGPSSPRRQPPAEGKHEDEGELFELAMADVDPIDRENIMETRLPSPCQCSYRDVEEEALLQLRKLIENGEGFEWHRTPEYIEGWGYIDDRPLLRSLRRGDFSIQGHLDLHGLPVSEAHAAFESFLQRALRDGKRALLIIHGRGLSSPVEPVLKKKVQHWLHGGRWRRWLLAYTSARACDGGAGATYVLLRRRPLSRHQAKEQF
jgi:DNA-nicking Smr family endonuclease